MRERPVSVTIFGILNIGFGLLALGETLLSTMSGGMDPSSAFLPWVQHSPSLPICWRFGRPLSGPTYVFWHKIFTPLDAAAALALVAAGIGLLLLKSWSRFVSIGFAMYTMISAFVDLAVMAVVLHRQMGSALQATAGSNIVMIVGAAVLGLVRTLIYPVLLLYFLTRPKIILTFQAEPA